MKKSSLLLGSVMGLALTVSGVYAATMFSDVPADHWAAKAVDWAKTASLVEGYQDGTFKGNNNITRYENVQILSKYDMMVDKEMAAMNTKIETLQKQVMELEKKVAPVAMNLLETAKAKGNFTTLLAAVEKAGLTQTLNGTGPFTIFAPTDAAFTAFGKDNLDKLTVEELAAVLKDHVVAGKVMSTDLKDGMSVKMLSGDSFPVKIDGNTVMIKDAKVTTVDLGASNGVIHVIDKVIVQ